MASYGDGLSETVERDGAYVAPTLAMYEQPSTEFARRYWWWFWLSNRHRSGANGGRAGYSSTENRLGGRALTPFTEEIYEAYLKNVSDPATIHAMCEDYRGGHD